MPFIRLFSTVIVLCVFSFASLSASASDGAPISKEEILTLVKGKTVKAKIRGTQGIVAYTAKLHDDGLIETKLDYHAARDKGKWTIEDGLYCAKYNKFRFGKKNCWQILQTGPGEYLMKGLNGAKDQTVKVSDAKTLIVRSK